MLQGITFKLSLLKAEKGGEGGEGEAIRVERICARALSWGWGEQNSGGNMGLFGQDR